jgi:RHS repeat-associated protein
VGTTTVRFYGKQLCSVPYADYINGSNTRDLSYVYNQLGNITSNTSTLAGDTYVTGYVYGAGAAGPHAVTSASIDGVTHTLVYDVGGALQNGEVLKYDIGGTSDDKYLAYNASNQPTKIVVGSSLTDSTPVAKDEFAYAPDGKRYARKSSWQEGGNTITEQVSYIGAVEIISDNASVTIQTITKTRLSANVMHVKIVGSVTEEFFEYAHRDHLGSIEVVTDDNGNVLDNLAFEPFGSRKTKDWTANISSTELNALLDLDWDHARKTRGFTGHEHLDRTGFIHMNGRVYDPVLGRFLSPDPIVQLPAFSQSWNRYSYVSNAPSSLTDPSGYVFECSGDCWNFDDFFFHDFFYHNDPRYDYVFFYDECDFTGCVPVDPFANEISQTETQGEIDLDRCRRVGCDFDLRPYPSIDARTYGFEVFIKIFSANSGNYGVHKVVSAAQRAARAIVQRMRTPVSDAAARGINVTDRGLAHAIERHTIEGARNAGKSVFNTGEDVAALARDAGSVPRVQQAGGNFERVIDAGRTIGIDRLTGQPTSTYTVITNAADDLITTFPGRP